LDSLALEMDHQAATIIKKTHVNLFPEHDCLSGYHDLLMSYAFCFILKQFELSKKLRAQKK